jgi:hypothetical protein
MATRLPASERTREGLTTLVEGRLSTASPKDELVKPLVEEALGGRSDRCGRTTLLDAPRPAGPEPPVRGARGACAEQAKHVARHGGGHRHTAPANAAGELRRVAPNRLVRHYRHAKRAELLAECAPAHARDDPPALPACKL